jgi:parallel beta-helix repeat protein
MKILTSSFVFATLAFAVGCGSSSSSGTTTSSSSSSGAPSDCTKVLAPGADDQGTVQGALIDAKAGDIVCLGAGTYKFTDELSIAATGVTLRGLPDSILDFSGQKNGGNGIAITGDGTLLDGVTVQNPKGDGIRATEVDGITFRKTHVVWTNGGDTKNGGYGLYPVQSKRVLIEDCVVEGAADAGIYVGQSQNIVVRRNEALHNVAGIEIENSLDSEVYENHSHDNVGGILIFALPGLPMLGSGRAKVHDNIVENNNTPSFAAAGNIVALVPTGTGMFIMASDGNEVHNNTIKGNISVGFAIVSWVIVQKPANDPKYDLYPESNFVHDNTLTENGAHPQGLAEMVAALGNVTKIPQLVWDGEFDPMKDNTDGHLTNCFDNNVGADFLDFDAEHFGKMSSMDIKPYTCKYPALPAIDPKGFPGVM